MRDEKGRIASESERTILDIIHRNPGISRSALTGHTDWKQQSVHRIVDSLVARHLVSASRGTIKGPGQPSPSLTLNRNGGYAFGVSLNSDAIRLALVNLGCEIVETVFVETDPTSRDAAILDIASTAARLARRHGVDHDQIVGIGFAITGYRLNAPDIFKSVAPLHEWTGRPLSKLLIKGLGYPIWIENNANAGAIAETLVGAGRDHRSFCYLSFNYGFGGGLVVNGQPLSGAHNNAGELSSLYMAHELSSRPALGELLKRIQAKGSKISSIRELSEHFDPEIPGVREWVREVKPLLELAVRALSATFDPSAVVFGGEAPAGLQELLIEACNPFESLQDAEVMPARPDLLKSSIEGDPATYGAALLPIKQNILL